MIGMERSVSLPLHVDLHASSVLPGVTVCAGGTIRSPDSLPEHTTHFAILPLVSVTWAKCLVAGAPSKTDLAPERHLGDP